MSEISLPENNWTVNFLNALSSDKSNNTLSFEVMSIEIESNVSYQRAYQLLSDMNKNLTHIESDELKNVDSRSYLEIAIVSIALGTLILATILGNIFVISAIILEKNLKCVGNYLVLSLAVTDLLVACLVMPLGAVYEVLKEWSLGPGLCEIWTCIDVLCCTASILHLLAIACDRFWAVTNVDYVHQRNGRHISGMIITVWVVSGVISLAPILGWKDDDFNSRIENEKKCLVSQDIAYQIFATLFSFYGPSALVLILYYRIYLEAKKRIRRKSAGGMTRKHRRPNSCPPIPTALISSTEMTTMTSNISSTSNASSENGSANSYQILLSNNSRNFLYPPQPQSVSVIIPDYISTASTSDFLEASSAEYQSKENNNSHGNHLSSEYSTSAVGYNGNLNNKCRSDKLPLKRFKFRKSKSVNDREVECKRERKAAKTLAIITGIFIVCWLPFFAVALIMPLCPTCNVSPHLFSFCLWLGWANSSVNPFLYTIFSPDFRCAFRKLLFGRYKKNKSKSILCACK